MVETNSRPEINRHLYRQTAADISILLTHTLIQEYSQNKSWLNLSAYLAELFATPSGKPHSLPKELTTYIQAKASPILINALSKRSPVEPIMRDLVSQAKDHIDASVFSQTNSSVQFTNILLGGMGTGLEICHKMVLLESLYTTKYFNASVESHKVARISEKHLDKIFAGLGGLNLEGRTNYSLLTTNSLGRVTCDPNIITTFQEPDSYGCIATLPLSRHTASLAQNHNLQIAKTSAINQLTGFFRTIYNQEVLPFLAVVPQNKATRYLDSASYLLYSGQDPHLPNLPKPQSLFHTAQ